MLILSLVIILLVVCTVCLHLFLRRRKRDRTLKDISPIQKVKERRKKKKEEAKKGKGPMQPELHGREKKIAELPGTPMCEIGESEPRHEIGESEVDHWPLRADWEAQIGNRTSSQFASNGSESDTSSQTSSHMDIEIGISWYDASEELVQPDSRQLAMYWARGI